MRGPAGSAGRAGTARCGTSDSLLASATSCLPRRPPWVLQPSCPSPCPSCRTCSSSTARCSWVTNSLRAHGTSSQAKRGTDAARRLAERTIARERGAGAGRRATSPISGVSQMVTGALPRKRRGHDASERTDDSALDTACASPGCSPVCVRLRENSLSFLHGSAGGSSGRLQSERQLARAADAPTVQAGHAAPASSSTSPANWRSARQRQQCCSLERGRPGAVAQISS